MGRHVKCSVKEEIFVIILGSLFQDDAESQTTSEKKDGTRKKKQLMKTLELPIEAYTHGYSQAELNNYMELEVSTGVMCVS
jgi:hypothetical protein